MRRVNYPALHLKARDRFIGWTEGQRRHPGTWSGLPREGRFWEWKLGPAKAHYP